MKFKLYEATAIDEDNIKKYQFYRPETISLEKFEETLIHVFDNLLDYEIFHGDKTLIKVLIVK